VKSLVALTTLFLLAMLCGCGVSLPTEDTAKKALQDELTRQADNRLQLLSFHKTNGQSSVVNGVQHYGMEWEGEVEVMEDGICDNGHMALITHVIPNDVTLRRMYANDIVKKGTRRKVSGQFLFIMTEKGWIVSGTSSAQMDKPW